MSEADAPSPRAGAGSATGAGQAGAAREVGAAAAGHARDGRGLPLDDLPEGADYRHLAPATRTVWLCGALVWWAVLSAGLVCLDVLVLARRAWFPWPAGAVSAPGALVLLVGLVWYARRSYAAFFYAVREWDVLIASGIVWRRRQSVPRMRIQHVDVASGPIDRRFGVVNLTMYTAGTGEADATIPGLLPGEAEALREMLLPTERLDV